MSTGRHADFARHWQEIALNFLKLGLTSYGGPAIMGLMQIELQEKRQWVSKEHFVEGLSLVNMLPGPGATQLGIFLGYARGGWWGGVLAGVCFIVPGFCLMLALTLTYAVLGVTPLMRGALHGLGPVVISILLIAVYRLGKTTIHTFSQALIALAAATAMLGSPLSMTAILLLAGALGLLRFYSFKVGAVVLLVLAVCLSSLHLPLWSTAVPGTTLPLDASQPVQVMDIGVFFFKVGALTFGGGLAMIPFIQDQVVNQLHWLTPQEFLDGLVLGQFIPGPLLIVSAYVGYKIVGLLGAIVGAAAIFLPSFIFLLVLLPVLERVRHLVWTQAVMQGIGPAVIGALAVALVQMTPHAVPDPFAVVLLCASLVALLPGRLSPFYLMLTGALCGMVRSHLGMLPGV